ncbi:FecR domain-containing protein [Pelagibius marinus]|uniref:FecR domain-containing protein n=1 Tax=Pelagibius marinus TaxID=2762760 RepID=UPI0018733476|nr:FecR domain-containing protein [Pelagibius marinus]
MVSETTSVGDLASENTEVVDISGPAPVTVDADVLFSADFIRLDDDLLLRGPEGGELLFRDYFAQEVPPQLETADGARLPFETVESLAGPEIPVAYAQAGAEGQLGTPIGEVSDIGGVARVQHPDGSRSDLREGDPIFQGDIVSTGVGSELGIVFVDDTVFSLSSNARMVIDELIYNPSGSDNSMGISLIQGTFVFVTGQVAPSGGMDVETPVGTIGIRGTTVGVQIATLGGNTRIVNLVNPDTGETGSFIFSNGGGSAQFTQANHFLQVASSSSLPGSPTVASSQVINNVFGRDLGNAIGIQRLIDRNDDDTPPAPPTQPNTNDQEGSLPEELPQDILEALLEQVPIETAAGPQALGGGAEFRLPPWLGQAFRLLSITPQGVIGEVDAPALEFPDIPQFVVFFTPESPVAPSAAFGLPGAEAGGAGLIAAIKEDSKDNLAIFAATAGNVENELTSIVLELPGFAPEDLDISSIIADLAGDPPLGTVEVTTVGGITRIVITFDITQDIQVFASSFTLDAPEDGSDVDLPGIKITATAQDLLDPTKMGSASASGTLVLDAVLDEAALPSQGASATVSEAAAAQDIPLDLSLSIIPTGFDSSGPDGDGSEAITNVTVVLSAGSLVLGAGAPAGSSIISNGGGSFTLLVANPADYADAVAALQVEVPAGLDGEVTGTIYVTTAEFSPSGAEAQSADNSLTLDADFSVMVTAGEVAPSASFGFPEGVVLLGAPAAITTILEDSEDNVIGFSVAAGDPTDELVSVEIALPGVAPGDVDIAQINADLAGPPLLGSAVVATPDGVTTIIVTFADAQDVQGFSSSFTLDAPVADSDIDLADIEITVTAKDITTPEAIGSASASGTIYVDAVADPVTVSVDAVSTSGDEAFAPGETGTVTVEATFGDSSDGSEVHTVTVTVPLGFTVTGLDGGTLDGDTVTWTTTDPNFQAVLQVMADDPLPGEQQVTWQAEATAVEQNSNTDPEAGDVEQTTANNTEDDQASDTVTLDPAGAPTVSVSLGDQALCIAEDGQGDFTVTVTAPGDDYVSEILLTNLPGAGEGWFTTVEGDDGGIFDPATGIYTTSGSPTSVILTVTLMPPPDSDLDVATVMGGDISFTATTTDPNSGDTAASAPVSADVDVDAVADGESEGLSVSVNVNDSGDPDGEFSPGETGTVSVSASFGDYMDGSELHTVVVDIPDGFTVVEPLPALAGVTVSVNGDGDVEFLVGDGVSGFTDYNFEVTASAGVADGEVYQFSATATALEEPIDEDCEAGNNEATSEASADADTGAAGAPTVGLSVPGDDGSLKEDTTGDVEITAQVTTSGDTLSQVVVTAPEGWVLSATAGGQIAAVEGDGTTSLTLTLVGGVTNFSALIQATPPEDSDVDGSFTVEATAVDGSDSAVNDDDFDVPVDAVADGGALVTTGGYGVSTNGSLVDLALLLGLQDGNPDNPDGDLFNAGGFDEDGSEAVTTIQVTLSGSPAIASDDDADLVYDAGFGGDVTHVNGSLVWTFTGTEAELQDLVASLQLDPADDYTGTLTVEVAVTTEEAAVESGSPAPGGDGSNGASGSEADDGDNAVTETFSFDVEAEIFLAGAVGINEIGLGVGTSVAKHGDVINTVNTGQNYIEIRNIVDHAVSTSEVKSLMIQIIGADGELVTIDLSTATGGSINIPPLGFLTIFEDGTWATSTPGGEIQQTGTYEIPGEYTEPGSVWGFGDDTSDMLGVYLVQDSGSVDMFLANGADGDLFGGTSGNWVSSGSATANAAALLGALIDLETYSGLVGDQDALLASLGRSDIVLDDAPAVDDEGTYIFSRVFADEETAGNGPGDETAADTNTSADWTTSNEPTSFDTAINNDDLAAIDDFNLQDSSDDLNPAQGAGTNEEDAGQTVLYADVDGDSLQGGRGQDFLFGNTAANLLQGGDHNDFLFGDQGDDRLEGGGGADFLVDVDGADLLIGGSGDDILVSGQEHLPGSVVLASAAGDLLIGDEVAGAGGFFGEDVILGGGGGNLIFGDTLLVEAEYEGSLFDLAVLVFNDVEGPALRAAMDGLGESDWIESGSGNDSVLGQGGDDTIAGQEGDDLLAGGDGADVYLFSLGVDEGSDEILDFSVVEGDLLSFTDVSDVDGPAGIDIEDAVASFTNNGGGAGIDELVLESGTVVLIHDVDDALSSIADVTANSLVNGS